MKRLASSPLWPSTKSPRGKAQLSLLLNFASRAPSIVGLLFFIPLMHAGLDNGVYGGLMAALALGGLGSMLFIGGNTLGRRRMGEAMAAGNHAAEADAFSALIRATVLSAALGTAVALGYALWNDRGLIFILIAMLQIINSLTGAMDEARAAYNEHYLTAAAQFVLQVMAYAIGLSVPWVTTSAMASALVMIGPSILSSVLVGGMLLLKRPYLLHGKAIPAWRALTEGLPIGLIDGLVMTAVNLSVVIVQAEMAAQDGAWYATIVRIFMMLLAPVILTLVPLTSYIRGIWNHRPHKAQARLISIWMAVSLLYGIGTVPVLWLANVFYIQGKMGLNGAFGQYTSLPIYAGLGAVVIFKAFSGFSYMVLGPRQLNVALSIALAFTAIAAIGGHAWSGVDFAIPVSAAVFAVAMVVAMLAVGRHGRKDHRARI